MPVPKLEVHIRRIREHPRWQSYFLLSLTTIFWGSPLVLAKSAFDVTTPSRILLYRMAIATLLTLPFLIKYLRRHSQPLKLIKKVWTVEFFGTCLLFLFAYYGVMMTSAIEASFISTTGPIFVVLAAILFLGEKQETHEWLGMGTAIIGTLGLIILPLINGHGMSTGSLTGNLLMVAANICMAIYFILAKWWYHNENKFEMVIVGFPLGLLAMLIFSYLELQLTGSHQSLWEIAKVELQNPQILGVSIFLAVGASIIANTAFFLGQSNIEASEASLFNYLQPLVAIPLAWWLLGETVSVQQVVFLIIILTGVVLAERRPSGRSKLWNWYQKLHHAANRKPADPLKIQERR